MMNALGRCWQRWRRHTTEVDIISNPSCTGSGWTVYAKLCANTILNLPQISKRNGEHGCKKGSMSLSPNIDSDTFEGGPPWAGSAAPGTVIAQFVEALRALAGFTYRVPSRPRQGHWPGAAPARPSGPNHQSLLQCERGSGRARWPRQPAGAVGEISVTRWPECRRPGALDRRVPLRTPEDFLAFLQAQFRDPLTGQPVLDAVPRFLDSHPTARAFIERLMQKPVPASYGQASYHAEHAFRFTAADGMSRFGRYRWRPEAGEASLSPDEASQRQRQRPPRGAGEPPPRKVRSCSASSYNWPRRAIRRTTSPPCGRRTDPWSNWGGWR